MPLIITDDLRDHPDDLRRAIEEYSPHLDCRRSALIRDGADALAHYRHEVAHATLAAQCRVALGILMSDVGRCAPPGIIPVDEMVDIMTSPSLDRQRDGLHWLCCWACERSAPGEQLAIRYRRWADLTVRAMVAAGLVTIEGRGDEEAVLHISRLKAEAEAEAAGQADGTQADDVARSVSARASREAEERERMDEQRERDLAAALACRCEADAALAGLGGAVEPEDMPRSRR